MPKTMPKLRAKGCYDTVAVSNASALRCEDEHLTQQNCKDECDLNLTLAKYDQGLLRPREPMYGDFTGVSDYKTAVDAVQAADEAFMRFPADVRERFGNDPNGMLTFIDNPDNREEAEKLGLLPESEPKGGGDSPPPPEPEPSAPVPEPSPAPEPAG